MDGNRRGLRWTRSVLVMGTLSGLLLAGSLWASSADAVRTQVSVGTGGSAPGDYWLGILGLPVDPALKTHLDIESGLVVQDVVPESPAAAAGLEKHDILLKFNEVAVSDLESLAAAVAENGDREAEVTVIRGGESQRRTIQPSRRPPQADPDWGMPPGDWGSMREWLEQMRRGEGERGPFQMWVFPPGVEGWAEAAEQPAARPRWLRNLPKGTQITITKPGDEPAKIVVQRDDETWNVDEEQLDELPEELREPVREMLTGRTRLTFRPGDMPRTPWRQLRPAPARPWWTPPGFPEADPEDEEPRDEERLERRLDRVQRRAREQQQRLQQEIERLRQEWRQRSET